MGINETVIVIGIILMVIDFFIPYEIPTFIAYILFTGLIGYNLDVPLLYRILISIIAFCLVIALHYFVFRHYLQVLSNKFISPTKYRSGQDHMSGQVGTLRFIENKWFVQSEGDLWECYNISEMEEGKQVVIISMESGKAQIKPM